MMTPERKRTKTYALVRLLRDAGHPMACEGQGCVVAADAIGIVWWGGKPLTLQVDHINGDGFDDRIENLRFLCPNCHALTSTFRARKGGGMKWPADLDVLARQVEERGWLPVARDYGFSSGDSVRVHLYRREYRPSSPTAKGSRRMSDDEFFAENTSRGTNALITRFLETGRGTWCENDDCPTDGQHVYWLGQVLRFEIDHIDGDRTNNLLTNLRSLCPNCHSQTDTFNMSKVDLAVRLALPPIDVMAARVREVGSAAYAAEVGLSINQVCRRLERFGISTARAGVRERFGVEASVDEIVALVQSDGWAKTGRALGGLNVTDMKSLLRSDGVDPRSIHVNAREGWPFERSVEDVCADIRLRGREPVAEALGVHSNTLAKRLKMAGIDPLPVKDRRVIDSADIEPLKERIAQVGITAAAKEFSTSLESVHALFVSEGQEIPSDYRRRGAGYDSLPEAAVLVDLVSKSGYTPLEKEYGASAATVKMKIESAGLTPPPLLRGSRVWLRHTHAPIQVVRALISKHGTRGAAERLGHTTMALRTYVKSCERLDDLGLPPVGDLLAEVINHGCDSTATKYNCKPSTIRRYLEVYDSAFAPTMSEVRAMLDEGSVSSTARWLGVERIHLRQRLLESDEFFFGVRVMMPSSLDDRHSVDAVDLAA